MNNKKSKTQDKKRVVFYARVSTDNIEQLGSLATQVDHFTKIIDRNEDWEFSGQYVDEGITGTSIKKRKDFQRMIADANDHKFDLILTREVSRFARNTVDTLQYTRQLKALGVGVVFTLDNINTLDADGEFKLTIMASVAQEEARKTSNNVKWKHNNLMTNGAVFGSNSIMGYDLKDKKLSINPEQAKVVQLIYDLFLQGKGERGIQLELMKREIKTPLGKDRWQNTTIHRILTNEKYIGRLVQGKSITPDFLEKKRVLNNDTETFIIKENSHEAIIDTETFEAVQQEIARRSGLLNVDKTRYSNKYVYSGKIKCGVCGRNLKHVLWNKHTDGTRVFAWKCPERAVHGKRRDIGNGIFAGCDGDVIPEAILNNFMKQVYFTLAENKDGIFATINKILKLNISNSNAVDDVSAIQKSILKFEEKISSLMELYTDKLITKEEFQTKKGSYDLEINKLQSSLEKCSERVKNKLGLIQKLESFKSVFNMKVNLDEADKIPDEIVEVILDHLVINDKENFEVHLVSNLGFKVVWSGGELAVGQLQPFDISPMHR